MYIITDETGRVRASSPTDCLANAFFVETPEGFDGENLHDWRLVDGALLYDPEPVQDMPTPEERIAALEAKLASYEAAYAEGVNEA